VPVAEEAISEDHVHGSVASAGDDVDAMELVDVDAVESTEIRAADEGTVVLASRARATHASSSVASTWRHWPRF
jgi:hypothetical protein